MKKSLLMMLLIGQLAVTTKTYSQNIAINGNGALPDTSAMLDVSSTVKGFLSPRMTTTQQNAIPLPAKGLLIYNTTDNLFKVNIGTAAAPIWTPLSTSTNSGTVTSVGLTSSDITVGGSSPITTTGAYTLTLPTVNSNVGTYTNATITVNAKGLVTAASSGVALGGSGWSLTGNALTTSSNFIGTTDAQPVTFKVGGVQAGSLGISSNNYATSFGGGSSAVNGSTAIGPNAQATGSNFSVAIGYNAAASRQDAIAIGDNAQAKNGNNAIAIGFNAVGGYTDAIAIGTGALASSSTNNNETIAIGHGASANSYQGIAIGNGAATSSNNGIVAIGVGANASGYQSTAIGNGSKATGQNSSAFGNGANVSNDNYISIGNTSVSAIRGQVNFTTYSDGRFKRNIQADVPGLDFVMHLRPVTYNWDIHKFNAHARGDEMTVTPAKYVASNEAEEAAIRKKESITYTGFIAQEVEKAAQDCKFNFSGVLRPQDDKDAYSLSYAEFVVPLVKAAQELNTKNEALNNKLDLQQKMIDQLLKEVTALKKKRK